MCILLGKMYKDTFYLSNFFSYRQIVRKYNFVSINKILSELNILRERNRSDIKKNKDINTYLENVG